MKLPMKYNKPTNKYTITNKRQLKSFWGIRMICFRVAPWRFVFVWPHANGAHSIIVNRFTWNIKSRSINLFRSHDVFKLISYLIAAPWNLRLLLRWFFDLDLRRSQVTKTCIFKFNSFTKFEIHLVEFPLNLIQLIKTNVFHQDMDIQNNYIMFICISFKEKKVIWDPLLESGVAPESEHGGSTKLKYDKVSRWVFLLNKPIWFRFRREKLCI